MKVKTCIRKTPIEYCLPAFILLAAILTLMIVWTPRAMAATGADAVILNVVQVTYRDASGNQSFTADAAAKITVTLQEAALTISGRPTTTNPGTSAAVPAEQTVASGATAQYLYALTANANGYDTYDLAVSMDAVANVANQNVTYDLVGSDGSTVIASNPATVTLGASVVINVPNSTTLEFPGGTLNNIAVGDIVVVNGVDYLVSAVTAGSGADHSHADGNTHTDTGTLTPETRASLTLAANTNGANATPNFTATLVGSIVGEQVLVRVNVYAETTTAGTDGTVDFDLVVNPDGTPGSNVSQQQDVTTTFTAADLTIRKEVRNVTQSGSFAASASGNPGDVLEYRVTVQNSGSNATQVVVSDAVPSYTTLVVFTDSYGGSERSGAAAGSDLFARVSNSASPAVTVDLTYQDSDNENTAIASGHAAGTAAASAITFYIGNGNSDTTDTGGTVTNSSDDTFTILYRVKID